VAKIKGIEADIAVAALEGLDLTLGY